MKLRQIPLYMLDNDQIFYASRTHSQLSQFVGELARPHFPPTYSSQESEELVKHIPLASRKQLCINPAVSRLSSQTAINERCLELQKKSSKHRCEFKLNQHDPIDTVKQRDFRDHALVQSLFKFTENRPKSEISKIQRTWERSWGYVLTMRVGKH